MTLRSLAFTAALALGTFGPALATPPDLELTLDEQGLRDSLRREGVEYLGHEWLSDVRSFAPLSEGEAIEAEGVFRLEVRLPSDVTPPLAVHSLGTAASAGRILPRATQGRILPRATQARVLRKAPKRVLFRLGDIREVAGDAGAVDAVYYGYVTARVAEDTRAAVGPRVRLVVVVDARFENEIERTTQELRALLQATPLQTSSALPSGSPQGLAQSLPASSPAEAASPGEGSAGGPDDQLVLARAYVATGDTVRAKAVLRQLQHAEAPALRRVLAAKTRLLNKISRVAMALRNQGDPQLALYYLESFSVGWTHSSAFSLDQAQSYVQLQRVSEAREALVTTRDRDPTIVNDLFFQELWSWVNP